MLSPNYVNTITIYNKLDGSQREDMQDFWQRVIIRECFFKSVVGQVQDGSSISYRNSYVTRIPATKCYLPYDVWSALDDEERQGMWTCSMGDMVVLGECEDEISDTAGHRPEDILQAHKPDAFEITAFSDNTQAAFDRHYRLGG